MDIRYFQDQGITAGLTQAPDLSDLRRAEMAKAAEAAKPKVLTGADYVKSKQADITSASDLDKVALATAVYLYMSNQHDEESGVLTIHHTDHTAWHAELNRHL